MAITIAALGLVAPAGVDRYVGLLSAAPDSFAGTYTEIADSSYARQPIDTWDKIDLGGGVGAYENPATIAWAALADDGVTISYWGLFDSLTGGDLLYSGVILNSSGEAEPVNVAIGDSVRFNTGDLKLQTEATP